MGKKSHMKKKKNSVISSKVGAQPIINGTDSWAKIENGTPKSARELLYKKEKETSPKTKNYDRLKIKRKRISDGNDSSRIDVHLHESEAKRYKHAKTNRTKACSFDQIDINSSKRVLKSKTGKSKAHNMFDHVDSTSNKKSFNRRKLVTEEATYIVEEPEDDENVVEATEQNISGNVRFANLFDEDYSDISSLKDEFLLVDGSDDDYEDEEVSDEDLFDGLEDEQDNENSLDNESVEDESYNSPISNSDEETCPQHFVNELHDNCSSCSDVTDQDAESDEEGNLGENRVAKVLKKANKSSPLNFDEYPFSDDDSAVTATRALSWILSNCDVQTFFNDIYQQNCLVVRRNHPDYYGNLFSTQRLADLLEKNYVEYGVNINVAEYVDGVRYTLNGTGRAYPRHVKAHIKDGHSIQLTNPQMFDDHIWYICEVLQELFGCFVGANTYLTPAGSAGFAPHWDDIDAFLLQIEGKKYWKVYAPVDADDELPRVSSGNFSESDMKNRKPIFEGWLEAGDMLYIPRGFIHQARTDKKNHSLHITISTGREWTYADVMDKLIPEAVTALASQRLKMRRGLPIGLLDMNGVADYKYRMEEYFTEKFIEPIDRHLSMLRNFVTDTCLASSVDLMAREFMKTALPPLITPAERKFHVLGEKNESLLLGNPLVFHPHIYVRFMRRHGQRLIFENETKCFIALRINNSRLYEGREEQTIDLELKFVPAFTMLLDHCPEWTKVGELPDIDEDDRQSFCQLLYNSGIILAKHVPIKGNKQK